jgi:hypothetical protein
MHRGTLDHLAGRLEVDETLEGPELEATLALVRPEIALVSSPAPRRANGRANGRARRTDEVPV